MRGATDRITRRKMTMMPAQDLRERAIIVYRGRGSFERKDKVSM